jgi:peptide/nickel transport system substrate-binding protein
VVKHISRPGRGDVSRQDRRDRAARGALRRAAAPYTQALLSAVPVPDPTSSASASCCCRATCPARINPPSGCRFHTRCPFADYWNKDQVFIDKITYLPITDSTVRLANLRSGSLDMIERVLATDIKTVRDNPKLKLVTAVELGYQGLTINLSNGPKADTPLAKDARVRQAFELSIDRDALNQVVFNGEFVVGNQWINPTNPYYQQAFPVPKRDVVKAKALLKEAGVTGRMSLDFMVPNNPETRQVAEVLQSMVAETGFDLKIRVTEFATSLKQSESGDYQLYLIGWSGRSDPDGNSYIFHVCGQPQNNSGYCDKDVDAWHNEARIKSDPAERKKIYEKITAKYLPEGSIKYLYHRRVLVALSDKVDGYKQMPDGLIRVVGVKLK